MIPRANDVGFKIVVSFESRPDGGLRAWSDDVPGFVLSHHDSSAVLADVPTALQVILSERFGETVEISPLRHVREALVDAGLIMPDPLSTGSSEFVARRVA